MVSAIILAAGASRRFKYPVKKPYLFLGDKPILTHTLYVFSLLAQIEELILVIHPAEEEKTRGALSRLSIKIDKVVTGGKKRQDSVARGLEAVSSHSDIVLVHDGVRPLVTPELVSALIKASSECKAVIPVVPCDDTIKQVNDKLVVSTVHRKQLRAAQTPQVFKKEILVEAHRWAKEASFYGTDDAELVEKTGHDVKIIPGELENIKITRPHDLVLAEAIMEKRKSANVERAGRRNHQGETF